MADLFNNPIPCPLDSLQTPYSFILFYLYVIHLKWQRHKPLRALHAFAVSLLLFVAAVLKVQDATRHLWKCMIWKAIRCARLNALRLNKPPGMYFFFLLPSSQVLVLQTKGWVYLASADNTMWALQLEKHQRRTHLCDLTHLSEIPSSIRACYPWPDCAGGLASAETRPLIVFFKMKMEGLR